MRSVDFLGQRAIENIVDERGFAAARNAGDDDEAAERKFDGDVLQIVLARAVNDELFAVAVAAPGGGLNRQASGKILAGERGGILAISRGVPAGNQLTTQPPGAGSEIDDVIGALDGLGIVLDHQHRVAEIAQAGERVEQAIVIARMQSDGRLVENIEHAAQLRSDLRGQTNALRFAAGERGGGAREAQIVEADGGEKFQAIADLFDHAAGDLLLALVEFPGLDGGERAIDGHLGELGETGAFHAHRKTAGREDGGRGNRGK